MRIRGDGDEAVETRYMGDVGEERAVGSTYGMI